MRNIIATACCYCLTFCMVEANAQKPGTLPPDLNKYINKVLETLHVPGASVAIVQHGKVLLAKGYGVKKLGEPDPVDAHTLFLIASNTKAFTTTALAMLVEEGKLHWNDKVIDHLPWFRMSDPYVTMQMTIRDLLVHHSGLSAYAGDMMLFPPSDFSRREILDKLRHLPLVHDFRTTYAYDNILYLAAGEVISAISGMSWESFVKSRIFDIVGMPETISTFSDLKQRTNFATAHARYDGIIKPVDNFRDADIGNASDPAGGIVSNATDMANWLITQLDSGKTHSLKPLFKPATTPELWKIVRPMPISRQPNALKPSQASFFGYGLGFRTYNYGKYQVIGHGGALRGFVSQIAMVPALDVGIVVLTNQNSSAAYWSIIYHVLDYYMHNPAFDWLGGYKTETDSALAKSANRPHQPDLIRDSADKPSLSPDRYAGLYTNDLMGSIRVTHDSAGLVLRFEHSKHFIADLEYFQYNTYLAKFRNMGFKAEAWLTFTISPKAEIQEATLKPRDPDGMLDFDEVLMKPVITINKDSQSLRQLISAELATHPEGQYGIAVKDLSSPRVFFMNEHRLFHAASTMKTPVLIEAYRQAAEKKLSVSDSIVVKNSFNSIYDSSLYSLDTSVDSDKEVYRLVGKKMTIYDLLFKMITMSSNLATNNMIGLVGAPNVMATMKKLGANDIRILRGVEDTKAFQHDMNNQVTAYDLMLLFERLAQGKMVDSASSKAMIGILQSQHFRETIPAKLPADVITATKTGSIVGISHDSGIVFLPDGRKYVVVLLSGGIQDDMVAKDIMSNVSKYIYDYLK